MIIESILNLLFGLVSVIISFLPSGLQLPNWIVNFTTFVGTGLSFFPSGVFAILISNVAFWLGVQMTWAIIEWLYKKVPGLD